MSEQTPAPVPSDPRKKALASALAQRIPLNLDDGDLLQMAHQVMLALSVQGYSVWKDDDLLQQYRDQKADHAALLHNAHATICLLLERLGGEVELEPDELARTAASKFSLVTVGRDDGTTALATFRPPT